MSGEAPASEARYPLAERLYHLLCVAPSHSPNGSRLVSCEVVGVHFTGPRSQAVSHFGDKGRPSGHVCLSLGEVRYEFCHAFPAQSVWSCPTLLRSKACRWSRAHDNHWRRKLLKFSAEMECVRIGDGEDQDSVESFFADTRIA